MSWADKMLKEIKAGKTRMEISEICGVPVGIISKYAAILKRTKEYRELGISDEQYAFWFETSLIGLKTADGELVIERTVPDEKKAASVLRRIKQGYEPEFELPIKQVRRVQRQDNCLECMYYTWHSHRCPQQAYEKNQTIAFGCNNFKSRERNILNRIRWSKC